MVGVGLELREIVTGGDKHKDTELKNTLLIKSIKYSKHCHRDILVYVH